MGLNPKATLNLIKTGDQIKSVSTINLWGCKTCSFCGTPLCPHGSTIDEYHPKQICTERIFYIKEKLNILGTVPRIQQEEQILKDILVQEKLLNEFTSGGELHPDLHKFSRNIFTAIKDLRRQNEGILISGEMNITSHDDFRQMIDIEAKKIQERDNRTRQAEFTEEIQPS